MISRQFTLYAPAKINLFLYVLKRRDDGYHDLATRMQKVALYDVINVEVVDKEGIYLTCDEDGVPADATNLAVRAANIFFEASTHVGRSGLRLHLKKNIPVAAGLGGGSSDAGTLLRGLNSYFGDEFDEDALIAMARQIGADVPFFAVDHPAVLATGIGDVMTPVPSVTDCSFILVNPDFFVATAHVFKNLSLTTIAKNSKLSCFQALDGESFADFELHNDLEVVTCAEYPEIERIKSALSHAGASKVLMSGSGPTVFGVFPDLGKTIGSDLQRTVDGLHQEFGEKVYLTRAHTGASPSGKAPGFDPGIS